MSAAAVRILAPWSANHPLAPGAEDLARAIGRVERLSAGEPFEVAR